MRQKASVENGLLYGGSARKSLNQPVVVIVRGENCPFANELPVRKLLEIKNQYLFAVTHRAPLPRHFILDSDVQ